MKRNISKIAVSLILISVMMIGASTSAFAVDQTICPESTNPFDPYAVAAPAGPYEPVEAVRVTVNGKEVVWPDATPFIDENNRTMVPLRAVGEAMGLYVDWNNDTRTAFFAKSYKDAGLSRVMSFKIDSNQSEVRVMNTRTSARVAQKIITMDTSAVIVQDRTYAPIRFLAESFGFTVGWDNDTRTVIITTDSNYNVSTIDVQTVVTPPSSQGQEPSMYDYSSMEMYNAGEMTPVDPATLPGWISHRDEIPQWWRDGENQWYKDHPGDYGCPFGLDVTDGTLTYPESAAPEGWVDPYSPRDGCWYGS